MFVKYKTPMWYVDAMEKFLDKMDKCSTEFGADLKKVYCCADTIEYTNKKMREAVGHRNKVKEEYSDKFKILYSKKNCSSNYNLIEAYANLQQANGDFFANAFWAKNTIKELKKYIIASRMTIKQNLAEMHDIWKKWYQRLVCTEKEKEKPAPKRKYQLTLTRAESLQLLKKLTYALKKDPTKDNFVMTLDEL